MILLNQREKTLIKDQFPFSTEVDLRLGMKLGQRQLQGKAPLAIDERVYRLIYVTQFEVCRRTGHTFLHVSLCGLFRFIVQIKENVGFLKL